MKLKENILIVDDDLSFTENADLYFKSRMEHFKTDDADPESLLDFNNTWNEKHPSLEVRTYSPYKKPKIIKGDIILSLK